MIATINVVGKVADPSGAAVKGGHIDILLVPPGGTADDGGTEIVIARSHKAIIDPSTGEVDIDLLPNNLHNGVSGSAYIASYNPAGGSSWVEFWTLDSISDPDPIDIGAITKTLQIGPGPTVLSRLEAGSLTGSALPTANSSLLGVTFLLDTGSGETATYICHRTASGGYDWILQGGGPSPDRYFTSEPATGGFNVGDLIFINPTGEETQALQLHRDASDVIGWVQTSSGGA